MNRHLSGHRRRDSPRSTERLHESRQHREVSVKLDTLEPTDARRVLGARFPA